MHWLYTPIQLRVFRYATDHAEYLAKDLDGEGKSEPDLATTHLSDLWSKGYAVDKFWGDGTFDVIELFNILEKHKTESAIPIRSNASKKSHGSMRRLWETFEFQTKSWNDWAIEKSYGLRWLGTECVHSAVKGIFGEGTRAKTPENACKEAKRKYWAYSRMKNYAKSAGKSQQSFMQHRSINQNI